MDQEREILLAFEAYGTWRPPEPVPVLSSMGMGILAILFGGGGLWMRKLKKRVGTDVT